MPPFISPTNGRKFWTRIFFEAFERAGGPDRETAGKFRKTILEKGYAVPPMRQFMDFMGRKPRMDAMLRKRRLAS